MTEDFGSNLRRFRLRAGLSQNALAKIVGINASYINRLESGEREAPTREVAASLARSMGLDQKDGDSLMFSAGLVPPSLQKLGPFDTTIAAVSKLLTNDRLSPEARADFRAIVETIAIRWQCNYLSGYVSPNAPKAEKAHSNRIGRNGYASADDLALAAAGVH